MAKHFSWLWLKPQPKDLNDYHDLQNWLVGP